MSTSYTPHGTCPNTFSTRLPMRSRHPLSILTAHTADLFKPTPRHHSQKTCSKHLNYVINYKTYLYVSVYVFVYVPTITTNRPQMASSAVLCPGNCDVLNRRLGSARYLVNPGSCLLMIRSNGPDSSPCRSRSGTIAISATMATEKNTPSPLQTVRLRSREIKSRGGGRRGGDGGEGTEAVAYERIDEWMRESVAEIVKNLRHAAAPLMVHVYRSDGVPGRMVMERAAAEEDWDAARRKWEAGEAPLPEGLIFVEELSGRHSEEEADRVTRTWGVMIQGREAKCPPVCYLLKTTTAWAGPGCGLGLACTHFCLVRVNGFWETAESQLKNCWLVQAQAHSGPTAHY